MDFITPELAASYTLVAAASYVLPGPDMAIIAPRALRCWRAGAAAAAGVQTGILVHCLFAIVGVSAVVATHPGLLTVLQLAGGVYLVWLGVSDWRTAGRPEQASGGTGPQRVSLRSDFLAGVGANVINPKAVLFFVAILPQFVPAGANVTSTVTQLALLDIALGCLIWGGVIATAALVTRLGLTTNTQDRAAKAMALIVIGLGILFVYRAVA